MATLFRKRTVEFFRACNVYCNPPDDKVIVAPVFNHGGLVAEKADQSVVIAFSDALAIHETIVQALDDCEYEPEFDSNRANGQRTRRPATGLSRSSNPILFSCR